MNSLIDRYPLLVNIIDRLTGSRIPERNAAQQLKVLRDGEFCANDAGIDAQRRLSAGADPLRLER
jgi:hypothetical protein